jgi:hypothetical protein
MSAAASLTVASTAIACSLRVRAGCGSNGWLLQTVDVDRVILAARLRLEIEPGGGLEERGSGYDDRMRHLLGAGAVALLSVAAGTAAASERLSDPARAFVEGYDPSGNDFFANVPERTVLLRIRADFDNDGITDIALSESSTWGNAGGQWLLFRGQSDGKYVYWGTLFFSPSAARVRTLAGGTSEMVLYVRKSVSRGTIHVYRVTSAGISPVSDLSLDLDRPSDRERYNELLRLERQLPVESCRLLEYRQDAATCWRPGLGLR